VSGSNIRAWDGMGCDRDAIGMGMPHLNISRRTGWRENGKL